MILLQVIRNNRKTIICKIIKIVILIRNYPENLPIGLMTKGTLIQGAIEKRSLALLLSLNNQYLRNYKKGYFNEDDLLYLVEQAASIKFKFCQHVFSTIYVNTTISKEILMRRYLNLSIHEMKSDSLKWDMVVSVVGAHFMSKNPFFNHGQLHGLGTPIKQRFLENKIPYEQTGQPNPDYLYIYLKDNLYYHWSGYYDLKTGKFNVNTGHVAITSNDEIYDSLCKKVFLGQLNSYKETNKKAYVELLNIFNNKQFTSWGERCTAFQEKIIPLIPYDKNFNPSIVIKVPLSYDLSNMKAERGIDSVINSKDCLADRQKTEKTMAFGIINGGFVCKKAFLQHLGASEGIKTILEVAHEILD